MQTNPADIASSIRQHLATDIMPFWLRHGVDREQGGYHLELDRQGRPMGDGRKTLVSHARMVDAFVVGWRLTQDREYLDCAKQGFRFLADAFFLPQDSQWLTTLSYDGAPLGEDIRAYDITSVAHALSNYFAATGDNHAMTLVLTTCDQMDLFFWDKANGGYFDALDSDWRVDTQTKSLDAHLHAIEALLSLRNTTRDASFDASLRRTLDLLIEKTDGAPLLEEYTEDWREPEEDDPVIKYGHLFKCAWLYLDAGRQSKEQKYLDFARSQLEHALQFGMDPASGVFESGTPFGDVMSAQHPWWAQCEAIAALARAGALLRDDSHLTRLNRIWSYCLARFHDRESGEWYAMLDTESVPIDTRKAHRHKSAYPLAQALSAAVEDLRAYNLR